MGGERRGRQGRGGADLVILGSRTRVGRSSFFGGGLFRGASWIYCLATVIFS